MKKLIIVILILLPSFAFAGLQDAHKAVIARMNVASGGTDYTDCSEAGTADLYWNGDHSTSTVTGCKDTSTTITGVLTGGTIVDSSSTPGTESPDSGGNVLLLNDTNEVLSFSVTTKDIFDSSEGRWEGDVYLASSSGDNIIVNTSYDGSNNLLIYVQSNNTVRVLFRSYNNPVLLTSTDTISDATWTHLEVRWDSTWVVGGATGQVAVKIGSGNWKTCCSVGCDSTDADAVTAWEHEPTTCRIGYSVHSDDMYVDNCKFYTDSGL